MPAPIDEATAAAKAAAGAAAESEQLRRLTPGLVEELRDRGLFRLCLPAELGGAEAHPAEFAEALEALSAGDGAAGWCAMIASTSGTLAAYLPDDEARAIYGEPGIVSGGVYAPRGQAVAEGDGYRVSGRWPFASGIDHCDWLMGGCVVLRDGAPLLLANGAPDVHLCLYPKSDAEVIDTWSVSGLRGTGSHDMAVSELPVPAARAVSLINGSPRRGGPLYAFPIFGLLALGIAAVGLGIARGALDDLVELAGGKTPAASRRPLAAHSHAQQTTAHAEAELRAARAFLREAASSAYAAAERDGEVPLRERALLRLAATHAITAAARAADAAYGLAGGSSIYESSALQRRFRDVHTATQHMMVGPSTWELAGRVLLGLETDATQL
jgi:alkylation response protein AidB-like acyl-CoA dehydrogenase